MRARLNPHFLFNTLPCVSVLQRRDPDAVGEAIAKLAELLRAVVRAAPEGARLEALVRTPGLAVTRKGEVEPAFEAADKVIEATYEVPCLARACMEPLNYAAHVREDECELWSGTQFQSLDCQAAALADGGLPIPARCGKQFKFRRP